jgi:hypothetical protein
MSTEQNAALPASYAIDDVANMQYLFCAFYFRSVPGFTVDGWRRMQENRGSFGGGVLKSDGCKTIFTSYTSKSQYQNHDHSTLGDPYRVEATELLLRLLLAVTWRGRGVTANK